MLTRTRTVFAIMLAVVGGLIISLGLMRMYDLGVAHADTGSAVIAGSGSAAAGSAIVAASSAMATPAAVAPNAPDPIADPGAALSTAEKLYHSGAWFDLAIFAAFVVLFVLYREDDWFRRGRRAAYFAAALGFLTVIVVPATQGSTPNLSMILGALSTVGAALLPHLLAKKSSTTSS